MEFLGVFFGLERVAIVAGAIIVGYWGFRLYATDKTPGLVFMSLGCAVLVVVLFTGAGHVERVRDARAHPSTTTAALPSGLESSAPTAQEPAVGQAPASNAAPHRTIDGETEHNPGGSDTAQVASATSGVIPPRPLETSAIGETSQTTATAETANTGAEPRPVESGRGEDILSARELGGRIVSVKSENLTLEWTPPNGG